MNLIVIIITAYIMDLLFGDPKWRWHPIRIIGKIVSFFEKIFHGFEDKKEAGLLVVLLTVGLSYSCAYILINTFNRMNYIAGAFISTFLIYACVSVKDLKDESSLVYSALKKNEIILARKNLSLIVGRDTQNLGEREITRATVETIAESSVDGIISPLFFAFLGGAPLCIAYKAINTLDSMLGHQNEKYKNFGWASAKIDELFNYIPARISAVVFFIAGLILRKNTSLALKNVILKKDFIIGQSSRIPETAMAELLGVQLGGVNYYQGISVSVPFMGRDKNLLTVEAIKNANRIMYLVSFIGLIIGVIILWLVGR
ncbi:MAG: adenosylcobinamide-phosphate synthase CbiB [Candidatus Omnitrophota bacterium]|nr:adenosylcobinamide-phosphate synthase CbiB [Candidatus Omnitrophota bacterium]